MIHPASAQLQDILGYTTPRPKAPFLYANDWGANYGLLLPFFILAFVGPGSRRGRMLFPPSCGCGYPTGGLLSQSRAVAGPHRHDGVRHRPACFEGPGRGRGRRSRGPDPDVGIISATPLGIFGERLDNPHSNDGRGNLTTRSVASALEGSPVLGYGSTRDVQGNFFSIAGGETAECPKCSPPQLGTQGHLWHLIFTSGVGGTVLFLGFIYYRYSRSLRDASSLALALTAGGIYLAVVMLVYDILGSPLAVIMISLALLWRNERARLNAFPRVGEAT